MAIRVAGKPPVAPPVEDPEVPEVPEVPEEMMEQEEAVSEPMLPMAGPGKVDPSVARYMTKDMGPFICANCQHFQEDGSCEVVSGPIDPEGVCILFTSPSNDLEGVAEDVVPMDSEEPVEEPVEEEPYE